MNSSPDNLERGSASLFLQRRRKDTIGNRLAEFPNRAGDRPPLPGDERAGHDAQ